MAQVVMELRNLLTMYNFTLFDFEYPIIDTNWKKELEVLFIDYFYFYEIGEETGERFKHKLKTKLKLIIPYYNELYESKLLEIDPLLTRKMEETITDKTNSTGSLNDEEDNTSNTQGTDNVTGSNSQSQNGSSEDNKIETDYPQTSNIETDIATRKEKLSNTNDSTISGTNETDSTSNINGTSNRTQSKTENNESIKDYKRVIEGIEGNQNDLLKSYRSNIININKMIIEDCKDLFILVY